MRELHCKRIYVFFEVEVSWNARGFTLRGYQLSSINVCVYMILSASVSRWEAFFSSEKQKADFAKKLHAERALAREREKGRERETRREGR